MSHDYEEHMPSTPPVPGEWYAEVAPLKGKYYGTLIRGYDPDGEQFSFEVWHNCDYKPSERELAQYEDPSELEVCDSHFESRRGYELAQIIAAALAGKKE